MVTAMMGFGPDMEWDLGALCSNVAKGVHAAVTFANEQLETARKAWKEENDATDTCAEFDEGQIWKQFCDMYCIEDAVVKGNSAVLRSLKGLEGHVLTHLHDMIQFYTTEVFDKVRETQEQINHNDVQLNTNLEEYVKQLHEQQATLAGQLNENLNTQLNQLNINNHQSVDRVGQQLQTDIKSVNENIAK